MTPIKMMLRKGFDFEDARDYCLMGCVEPQNRRIYQWTSTGYTQWPIAIEFVLNRGRMVLFDSYQGWIPATCATCAPSTNSTRR
ncbi:MAG: pyruvate formate lyase family protein [Klebsiella pneumoniae]